MCFALTDLVLAATLSSKGIWCVEVVHQAAFWTQSMFEASTVACCAILQLLNWYKRRHNPVEGCRLYRLAPQCSAVPTYLVLKAAMQPQLSSLDPRGVFAAHCQDHLYVWQVSALMQCICAGCLHCAP